MVPNTRHSCPALGAQLSNGVGMSRCWWCLRELRTIKLAGVEDDQVGNYFKPFAFDLIEIPIVLDSLGVKNGECEDPTWVFGVAN
eukprot:6914148-Heterocapsa_arctica.AAC.1